jgi:endonuclease G
MKTTRLFFLLFASLMMAACGSDDSNGGGEGGDANVNANQPTAKHPEVTRYEFPKLKGGSSVIVTHKTSGTYDASNINFSTEWDNDKKSQRWTCYQMHKGFGGNSGRYSNNPQYPFDSDLAAAGGKYLDDDYFWGSGFDHGHICPSADRTFSVEANKQTFYLTNMQPQYNKFNAGIWEVLEDKIRKWTNATGNEILYVCKGGTIDSNSNILKRISGKLIVPKYFFCALLLKTKKGSYRAAGFWFLNENNDRSGNPLADYIMSIDELEAKTGIDFFCNLPDDEENRVERSVSVKDWGL